MSRVYIYIVDKIASVVVGATSTTIYIQQHATSHGLQNIDLGNQTILM